MGLILTYLCLISLQQGVNNAEKFDYVSMIENSSFMLHSLYLFFDY